MAAAWPWLEGSAGAARLARLDAAGVDRSAVAELPGASGMGVAVLLQGGGWGAVIVAGANASVDFAALVVPLASGIMLLQSALPMAVNRAAAAATAKEGARLIWNAAPAYDEDETMAAAALVVANRVEAASLTGFDIGDSEAAVAAAGALVAPGRGAVVTLWPVGSVLATGASAIRDRGLQPRRRRRLLRRSCRQARRRGRPHRRMCLRPVRRRPPCRRRY